MTSSNELPTALITGSSGGIGTALCEAFTAAGYEVIGLDIKETTPQQVTHFVEADLAEMVTNYGCRADIMRELRHHLPRGRLHVLVNNAAVQVIGSTEELTSDDWQTTLHTNVVAPFLLTQQLLPELEAARGCVVNIASVHAALTKPGFVCYATSKSALTGLTRALAMDLGGRVRVNAIHPAATATPMLKAGFAGREQALLQLGAMHPIGRIAEPSEIASVAVFLASDAASFVSGSTVSVDGGILGRLHDPE